MFLPCHEAGDILVLTERGAYFREMPILRSIFAEMAKAVQFKNYISYLI